MEASSSPLSPLGAVRTVYPKLSRNAFSHSKTSSSSSMQRSILLWGFKWTGNGMGELPRLSVQYFDLHKLFKIAHSRFFRHPFDHHVEANPRLASGRGREPVQVTRLLASSPISVAFAVDASACSHLSPSCS